MPSQEVLLLRLELPLDPGRNVQFRNKKSVSFPQGQLIDSMESSSWSLLLVRELSLTPRRAGSSSTVISLQGWRPSSPAALWLRQRKNRGWKQRLCPLGKPCGRHPQSQRCVARCWLSLECEGQVGL